MLGNRLNNISGCHISCFGSIFFFFFFLGGGGGGGGLRTNCSCEVHHGL